MESLREDKHNFTNIPHKGKIILLEGIVGVGKTTAIQSIKNYFIEKGNQVVSYNEIINTSLLDLYLSDVKKYAFTFQLYVLGTKIHSTNKAIEDCNAGKIVLIDRSIFGDMAFAQMLNDRGKITDDEYKIYKLLATPTLEIFNPNMIIYMTCDYKCAIKRVTQRGNINEISSYDTNFMNELNSSYMSIFSSNIKQSFNVRFESIDWNDNVAITNGMLPQNKTESLIKAIMN